MKASVPLQSLVDHTATRILEMQEEVVTSILTAAPTGVLKFELISKAGSDGSGNHSEYNQKLETGVCNDSNMLLTSVVPLILHFTINSEAGTLPNYHLHIPSHPHPFERTAIGGDALTALIME